MSPWARRLAPALSAARDAVVASPIPIAAREASTAVKEHRYSTEHLS